MEGTTYPRFHKEYGSACPGLVHAEKLLSSKGEEKTVYHCDTCYANPQ